MRHLFILFVVFSVFGCKKESAADDDYTLVTYIITTEVGGFGEVKYAEYFETVISGETQLVKWTISTPGTFYKTVKFKKGYGAEIEALHPSSEKWSLSIKNNSGVTISTNEPMKFYQGPPGYFYTRALANIE